jgi:hypothetical protein
MNPAFTFSTRTSWTGVGMGLKTKQECLLWKFAGVIEVKFVFKKFKFNNKHDLVSRRQNSLRGNGLTLKVSKEKMDKSFNHKCRLT